jgi:hypothetical protein
MAENYHLGVSKSMELYCPDQQQGIICGVAFFVSEK